MPRIKYAILNRIHVRLWVVAALVGGFSLNANAGYAQLAPPPGWSAGTGAGATYAKAANDVWSTAGTVRTNAALNVGGRTVTVPAAMRLASNAPRFAAAALFLSPHVRAAVGIASWLGLASITWDAVLQKWVKPGSDPLGLYIYSVRSIRSMDAFSGNTASEACSKAAAFDAVGFGKPVTGTAVGLICEISVNGQTPNSYEISQVVNPNPPPQPAPVPLTQPEFEDALIPKPMPSTVPNELPMPTPLPVQQPLINPSPEPALQPQPLRVPMGEPQPIPNTDPQQWKQPVIDIVPSPTTAEPWRVDVQPKDVIKLDPTPIAEPEPLPNDNPAPDSTQEKQPDLCEKNPDILACSKPELDTPDSEIPKTTRDVSLIEENPFSGGSCPADVYFAPNGLQQLKVWDWNQACGYITSYVQPILIICCTFAAFMILIPGRTE